MFRWGGGHAKKTCQLLRNQWKKFEFSLRISLVLSGFIKISQFWFGNDVQYKAATSYHPQRYLCIICGVFG